MTQLENVYKSDSSASDRELAITAPEDPPCVELADWAAAGMQMRACGARGGSSAAGPAPAADR